MCPEGWSRLCVFLDHWQSLVAGLLALIAGVITVAAIFRQTKSHEREARERRERLVRAYRASLSDDLAAIARYAKDSGLATYEMLKLPSRPLDLPALETPSLDPSVLEHLRMLIENHDPRSGEILADLIGCYQIQQSRLAAEVNLYNPPSMRAIKALSDPASGASIHWNVVFTVSKTVELYLRSTQLFKYARREVRAIAPPLFDEKSVNTALLQIGLFDALDQAEKKRVHESVCVDKPLQSYADPDDFFVGDSFVSPAPKVSPGEKFELRP
jgi:hypothetical protein